ncbi:MAG: MBL fold metallo-hydrolase [Halanaerobiaceae bacterium]
MNITIIYDNESYDDLSVSDWGFSCLIEKKGSPVILFDTGAKWSVLKNNMRKLNIKQNQIDEIFISHPHWDHVGGLPQLLQDNEEIITYIPPSCYNYTDKLSSSFPEIYQQENVESIEHADTIHEGIYSTGELDNIEQSLVIKTDKGLVIITGCSHPGVGKILDTASQFGELYGLIGGLHGFDNYHRLQGLELICPTHCTQNIIEIKARYPRKFVKGGVGKIIELK